MLSDHTAHVLSVLLIFLAAAIWTAAHILRWATRTVDRHVERALATDPFDTITRWHNEVADLPMFDVIARLYATAEAEAAEHGAEVVAEAEALRQVTDPGQDADR